ncbi:hypothetical protein KGF57_002627 [Candida theae]|uniref:Uncharacterized protein n=1 Tax=Candida theae TaxID=1198502 RepID=A0AAD5BFD1_9ASCO|nr:uncharacterized protein KGF57_002627 [Candida theae]KAI5958272.1 hypothetical protein KGF57_002627 [Candida theae]
MIRGNWSLAQEFKQNERKQQSKIQQRQKHQHKLEKLKNADPIKLYHKIKNLESREPRSNRDEDHLTSLKEDWHFIEKNGLHKAKIGKFLEDIEKQESARLKLKNKLWGRKSIYFNPELNPLGKVPNVSNLEEEIEGDLENLTLPLRDKAHYEPDPLIKELNVKLPSGKPPKFYKLIQNTEKPKKQEPNQAESNDTSRQSPSLATKPYSRNRHHNSESDLDLDSVSSSNSDQGDEESEDEPDLKKVKYG